MGLAQLFAFMVMMVGLASSACQCRTHPIECRNMQAFLLVALDEDPESVYASIAETSASLNEEVTYYFVPMYSDDVFDPVIVRADTCTLALSANGCASETIVVFDNMGVERMMLLDAEADGAFEEAIYYRPDGALSKVYTDRDENGWFDIGECVVDHEIEKALEGGV